MHKITRNILIPLLLSATVVCGSDIEEEEVEIVRAPVVNTGNAGVSLTLSDIKVALYNLLGDTINNTKAIKKLSSEQSLLKKEVNKPNKKITEQIKSNTTNISNILKFQKKQEREKILYKKEIERFIEDNKNLLPEG